MMNVAANVKASVADVYGHVTHLSLLPDIAAFGINGCKPTQLIACRFYHF